MATTRPQYTMTSTGVWVQNPPAPAPKPTVQNPISFGSTVNNIANTTAGKTPLNINNPTAQQNASGINLYPATPNPNAPITQISVGAWQMNPDGSFQAQPVIKVNGVTQVFNSAQDALNFLNTNKSRITNPALIADVNRWSGEFQKGVEYNNYIAQQNQPPTVAETPAETPTETPATPAAPYDWSKSIPSTGDPTMDAMLRDTAEKLYGEYKSIYGLTASNFITPDVMKQLETRIDSNYGNEFARLRQLASDTYNQTLKYNTGISGLNTQQANLTKTRATEDLNTNLANTAEDKASNQRVLGRNYQQATEDSQLGYQMANRTFSGDRMKAEGKLTDAYGQDITDLNSQANRINEANKLTAQRSIQNADLSLQQEGISSAQDLFDLNAKKAASLQDVLDYRNKLVNNEGSNLTTAYTNYINSIMNMQGTGSGQNIPQATVPNTNSTVQTPTVNTTAPQRTLNTPTYNPITPTKISTPTILASTSTKPATTYPQYTMGATGIWTQAKPATITGYQNPTLVKSRF